MIYTKKEIFAMFSGKLVGTKKMRDLICEVVSKMPTEIIEFITQKCWFMGSMDDAWAFAFTGNDLKDQHLIFLSDSLFEQNKWQIYYSIAHEVGHVVLGHRNSTFTKQSKQEIEVQEKQADNFARTYIK